MTNTKRLALLTLMSAGILGACGTDSGTEDQSSATQETTTESQSDDTSSETSSSSESASSEESSSSNGNQNNQQGINNQEFSILLEDAVQIFNDTNPGASIESVQFDDDDDETYEYDVDGFDDTTEYELSIDANSGETRDQETDNDDDDDNDNEALNFENIISPQEAMDSALSEIGSGHVEEWELDMDNGRPVYDISLENTDNQNDDDDDNDEITIHAETGEVLSRD